MIELNQQGTWCSLQTAQPTLPRLGTNRYPEDLLIWAGLDGTGSSVTSLHPLLGLFTDRPAHKPTVRNPQEVPECQSQGFPTGVGPKLPTTTSG